MAFMPLKWFLRMLEGWKWNCGVFIPSDMLCCPPCLPPPCYNFISSPSNSSSCNSSVGPLGSSPRRHRRTSLTSARLQPQLQQSGGSSLVQVFPVVEHCIRHQPDFTEHPCNGRSGSVFLRYLFSVFLEIKIQKKSIVSLKEPQTGPNVCSLSSPFLQRA